MAIAPRMPGLLSERQQEIESALHEQMDKASASGLPLYRMMRYQLGWLEQDGSDTPTAALDRFFGALCLEAASMWSKGNDDAGGIAAAAVELMYESLTVHEEMQSGEARAETRPAVWWIWGPAQAINVGDGLHALARLGLFRFQESLSAEETLAAVNTLDSLALRYYEGQYLELTYQERIDVTAAQYLAMAEAKTGALFGGTMSLGARAAGASGKAADSLWAFGSKLGIATQIRQDVAAIWDDESDQGRLLNKSKLYPIIHALETGSTAQKRSLGGIYFKRVIERKDLDSLRSVLDEVGSKQSALALANDTAAEALQLLDAVGVDASSKERWEAITKALIEG
jgi:geranylgeranyl diphosphate synthase type I